MTDLSRTAVSPIPPAPLSRRTALRRLAGAGVGAAAIATPLPAAAQTSASAAQHHEALIHRLFAALNGEDMGDLTSFIAPDHVFHACARPEPIVGRAAFAQFLAAARERATLGPYVLGPVVADGEQVAAQWSRVSPAIDWETGQPTDGVRTATGQFICRFQRDQLVETWSVSFATGPKANEVDS